MEPNERRLFFWGHYKKVKLFFFCTIYHIQFFQKKQPSMFKANKNANVSNLTGSNSKPSNNSLVTLSLLSKKSSKNPFKDIFCVDDDSVKICCPTEIDATLKVTGDVEVGSSGSESNLNVSGNLKSKTLSVENDSNFNSNVSIKGSIQGNTIEITNDSLLKGNVQIGSSDDSKDLRVYGKLKAKTIEIEEGFAFDLSEGFSTEGIISCGSFNVENSSVLKGNLEVSGTVNALTDLNVLGQMKVSTLQVNDSSIFKSGAFFEEISVQEQTNLKNVNISGSTVANDVKTTDIDNTNQIKTGSIIVEQSCVVDGNVQNKQNTQTNTLNVLNNSFFGGNVDIGSDEPRSLTVSGNIKSNSLQTTSDITCPATITTGSLVVNQNAQFNDHVFIGSSASPKDLVVSRNLKTKTLEVEDAFNFDAQVTFDAGINSSELKINGISELNGNVSIGSPENLANLRVWGNVKLESLEIEGGIDLTSGIISESAFSFGSLNVTNSTTLNNLQTKSATINEQLTVNSNSSFNGNMNIQGDASINNLNIVTNLSAQKIETPDIEVSSTGKINVVQSQNIVNEQSTTTNTLNVSGQTTLNGNVSVGSSTSSANINVLGNATVKGLEVQELTNLNGNVSIGSESSPANIDISGSAQSKNLKVKEYCELKLVNVTESLSCPNINGSTLSIGSVGVISIINSDNIVNGQSLQTQTLTVKGQSIFENPVTIGTNDSNTTFDVLGKTTLSELEIKGTTTTSSINTKGNVSVGSLTEPNDLTVFGDSKLDTLQVEKSVNCGSLNVSGNSTLKSIGADLLLLSQRLNTPLVQSQTIENSGIMTTGTLVVSTDSNMIGSLVIGDTENQSSLTVFGTSAFKNVQVTELSCTGKITCQDSADIVNLTVLDSAILGSAVIIREIICPSATLDSLNVSGNLKTKSIEITDPITFDQGFSSKGLVSFESINVSGQTQLDELIVGTTEKNANLKVNGNTITEQLIVNSTCNINGNFTVVAESDLHTVKMNQLTVNGMSTFSSNATFNSGIQSEILTVTSQASIDSTTTKSLSVTQLSNLNQVQASSLTTTNGIDTNTITVGSTTTLNGLVNMNASANINVLNVSNDSTFNGNISIGTQEIPKNLTVSGVLSTKTLEVTDPINFGSGISTTGSLTVEGTSQLKGQVDVGTLQQPSDLNVSGSLKTSGLSVDAHSIQNITTLGTKKLILVDDENTTLFIDQMTPQYHEFKILNRKSGVPSKITFDFSALNGENGVVVDAIVRSMQGSVQDSAFNPLTLSFEQKSYSTILYYTEEREFTPGQLNVILQTDQILQIMR